MLPPKEQDKAREHLAGRRRMLESTLQTMIDGYTTACFVWGPPGLGKSYVIRSYLDGALGSSWIHHTAYSTPKGLLIALAEQPNAVHCFEDCERVLKHELSASILRAACGEGPTGQARWVTYETAHEKLRINFRGSICIVTNQNLAKLNGAIQGVASRFRPVQWTMNPNEIQTCIIDIAKNGFNRGKVSLNAKQCLKVAEDLIRIVSELTVDVPLDLRMYTEHALPTFAAFLAKGDKEDKWHDVLITKLSGLAGTATEHREDRNAKLRQLAANIAADSSMKSPEKVAKWKAVTGLGQAIYYRHLKATKRG